MKDVAHRDDIGSRKRLGEEIAGGDADAVAKTGCGDRLLGDRGDDRQIVGDAAEMWVAAGEGQTQLTSRTAYVAYSLLAREIEMFGGHLARLRR